MGNCLELRREKKLNTQVDLLRTAQNAMQELARQSQDEKDRVNKDITDIGLQIAAQLKLYRTGKCSRETAERKLKELKFKERLAIADLDKKLKNELAWRGRASKFADTEMSIQNSHQLGKLVKGLQKVDIKVDNLEDVMIQMDDQLADMNDATSRVQTLNDDETSRGVENTAEFEREAALSAHSMLDEEDAKVMDLDAMPKPRMRAPLSAQHRILAPAETLRSEEGVEEDEEQNQGFIAADLKAGEDHTVFENLD